MSLRGQKGRGFRYFDPARRQILQHAHPVDLRPAHRNHRHRPKTPQPKPWRVTSLSGPTVTSLSGVYILLPRDFRLWNPGSDTQEGRGNRGGVLAGALVLAVEQNFQLLLQLAG